MHDHAGTKGQAPKGSQRTEAFAPARMGKRIVVCIDGTNNDPAHGRTNVSRFYRMLAKIPDRQVAYYQPGVGTLQPDSPGSRLQQWLRRVWDSVVGWMIRRHVLSAYRYLMNEYRDGDQIFLIGFSRGAYVCRVVAGMIAKVGLLHHGQEEMLSFAWRLYQPHKNFDAAARFKKYYSHAPAVAFLGVWDTVRSVGLPWRPRTYASTVNNKSVCIVRHAIALDECRCYYPTNLWGRTQHGQDVLQVFFPGVHSDVGGGYIGDGHSGLGTIPLAWMVKEAEAAGLCFDEREKQRLLWRREKHVPPVLDIATITTEFARDETHDEIAAHWYWRLAEWLPIPRWKRECEADGVWRLTWRPHRSEPRSVPPDAFLHRSVQLRMQRRAGYEPQNITPRDLVPRRLVW
jgi:uncharacterized protein (DUF2235 family)